MKRSKTRSTLLLSAMMVLTLLLGACSGNNGNSGSTAAPEATKQASNEGTSTNEGAGEEKPFDVNNLDVSTLKPVELSYYYLAWSDPADIAAVNEAVNKITKEKINATIKLNPLTWDNFVQRTNIMASAGDEYDLVFTSNWINPYVQGVAKGAFVPLDDLFQYMPTVKNSIKEEVWDAARINGKIYGAINKQILASAYGVGVLKEYVDKYNIKVEDLKTEEDKIKVFEKIKADNPDVYYNDGTSNIPNFVFYAVQHGFDPVGDGQIPGWVRLEDGKNTVINQYETEEFKKLLAFSADNVKKGYIDEKAMLPGQSFEEDHKAGKYPVFGSGFKPGEEAQRKARYGKDVVIKQTTTPIISTNSATATLTAISTTSKNPERAAMFIELLNTNKELYNLMSHGIEGKHYKKVSDQLIEKIADSGYSPGTDWIFGNQFNAYYTNEADIGNWELTEEINNTANISNLLGFTFDPESVKTEIAAVKTVIDEYTIPMKGFFPEKYDEFINKLKTAGMDKILQEKQKQIDAWMASR